MTVVASIYYAKNTDPRTSSLHHKLYFEQMRRDEETGVFSMPKKFFEENYEYISRYELQSKEDMPSLFSIYNQDHLNPLSTPEGQARIRSSGVRHTSMSVGDIVKIDGKYFIVAPIGWREVAFT